MKWLLTLLNSIEESGKKEEAEEFIKENLKYQSFREIYIDKCMKEKNYYKALELAQEGEVKDKDFAGLVLRWKKLKYDAYKKLSLIEEQEKLAKDLLLDGSFEYYKELKELHKKEESDFYDNIKEELKKLKGWRGESTYLQLIVEEKDLDEIMEYVRLNPRTIEDYATMLLDKYKDDVIEVYKKYIKHQASISSNRSNYKNVCRILKQYKKIAGQQNFENIKGELSMLYRNRPAFLDELSKIR